MAKKFTVADIIAVEQDKETTTAPTQTSGAKRFSVNDIEAAENAKKPLLTSMAIDNMMLGFGRNKLNAIESAIPDDVENRAKVDSAYDYLTTKELRGVDDDSPLDITRGDGLTEWITKNYDSVTGKPAEATKSMVLPAGGTMGGTTFIKGNEDEAKAALRAYDNDFLGSRNKMAEAIVNNLPLADEDSDDEDLKAQGRVMLGDQIFNRAEAIQAARRLVSETMHPTLLRSNKAYRDNYFISTTGKNFEDFKLDKVSEWSSKLAELEKVLSADVKSMSSAPSLFSATGVSPQLAMAITAEVEGMGALNKAREQIASLKDNDFFAGLDEGFDLVSMLTAGITTMGGNIKLNNVLDKVAGGKALTPSEKALYDVYGVQQEVEQMFGIQGRSGWNNIGLGVGGSAEVVLPMAAGMGAVRAIPGLATKALGTRTAYAAARQAFKKNTWRGLGEAIKQTAKVGGRTIANTGRATAGGLITAPFTPKMWSDFVEKRNEQYRLVDGKLEYTPTKAYKDLYGAIVDQTTEIASEIAGVGLSSFLRGGAKAFGRMLHLDDIADAMGIGFNTRSVFGWRKPNWWRVAEQNIGFSGALSEPLSEVWGDVMRNTMKAPFGMSNFAEMATADYWKTTFAVSAIYGGSLQLATVPARLAHIQQTMKLGGQAKRALSRIENTALRNNLLSIINNNDYESAAQQMAQIPWNQYSRPDVGYAMDYIAAELPRQVGLGYIEEDMRLNAFRTEANRLANLRYKGVNGNDQTNLIVSAVTPDGVAYTVESGDYNNLDDGLLIVRDANGVKMPMAKNKIATVEKPEDYTVTLQNTYTWLYSREVEEQRVQSVKDALAEMKEPTVEQVDLLMANNGFKEHSVGDIVALADGRTAEVLGRLPNGNYDLAIIENGEAKGYANAPFYDVLSDAPMTRDAQLASYERENGKSAEKPAEVAPAEAPTEEVAEEMPTVGGFSVGEVVNTSNGKARITAFGDNGEVMVDMNLENTSNNPNAMALVGLTLDDISREVAPAETTTDATTEQVSVGEQTAEETPAEVESADTTPEIKSVPRLENGEVDYNAITDPDLYAEYFARDMGSKEAASAQMAKMIAATQSEVEKLAKKGDSLVDANAVVANNKEIARLNERINLYNTVQMALIPAPQVETTATAEAPIEEQTTIPVEEVAEVEETPIEAQTEVASGVVPNELSEGIATEHLAVVDAMAKMLGVRITFVPEVRDSNGNLQNAKIVGKDIYIAAGATQIETISFLTGHEFTHRMKKLSPEQYAKLEDSVRNYLGDEAWEAEMATHTNTYRKVQRNITDEEIAEEVVADFIGRQVRDNNLFTQYLDSIKDKGLVDAIKSVLRAIRDFFRNINATAKDKALDEVISNLNTLIESASAKAESAESTREMYSLREVMDNFKLTKENAWDFEYALMQSIAGGEYGARGDYRVVNGVEVRVKGHTPNWDNFVDWDTDEPRHKIILNVTVGDYENTDYRRNKTEYEEFVAEHPDTIAVDVTIEDGTYLGDALNQTHDALAEKGADFSFEPNYDWADHYSEENNDLSQSEARYSLRLPKEEYAKLTSTIMTRQHTYNRPSFDYAFTFHNFYVYDYLGEEVSLINFAMPIVGNEDLIQNFTTSIDNGTITDTRGFNLYAENLQGKQRTDYRRFANAFKKRYGSRGYGVAFGGNPTSNGGAYLENSTRVSGDATSRGTSRNTDESTDRGLKTQYSLRELDASYLDAVERGDMAMAQRMVQEAAEHAGYLFDTSYQGSLAFNGAAPTSNAYFETKEERKQAWDNDEFEDTMSLGDYADNGIDTNDLEWRLTDTGNYRRSTQYEKESIDNINKALKNPDRKITIYRAVPNSVVEGSVRNGDWVTPSRSYAEYHIGLQDWEGGRVIEQEVSIDDIWWGGDDVNEWGYDDGSNYGYRNTENNRKLFDTVTYDDAGNIIPLSERFNPNKKDIRYSVRQPIFYSNAEYAVRGIKQEKATPEQWLKMIEKNGGLKAGEDKWLGLSDWLKASTAKTLTKNEILQYIAENDIQIEEVSYGEPEYISENEIYESDAFSNLVASLTDYDEDDNPYINKERYTELQNVDPDFLDGFSLDYWGEGLDIDDKMAAARYLGLLGVDNEINNTRLQYTTQGLTKKKEIALVVPTIEPYNQSDEIHFGDAGEGRAVAWVRFGDAEAQRSEEVVRRIDEFEAPYKDVNGHEIYRPKGRLYAKDFISYGKLKSGEYAYVVYVNDKQIPVAHKSLEDARNALNEHYRANPGKRTRWDKVLVIDEIQSKRHQDGREKGYKTAADEELENAHGAEMWAMMQKYNVSRPVDLRSVVSAEDAARLDELSQYKFGEVPSAPFEKNWAELAMKRMLRYAAENGYDYVAWTTGDQQADRYDIGSVVKDIVTYDTKDADGNPIKKMKFRMNNMRTYNIATNAEGVIVKGDGEMKEGMRLSDITGKALAEKIMNGEGEDAMVFENGKDIEAKSLEGEELHIGNEGMKAFYDQMLPSFVRKYAKKWGATVGEVTMPDLAENNTMHAVNVTDSMRESVMQGQPKFSLRGSDKSLVGLHNISLDKLRKAIKMGGLANPSVAVIDVDKATHEDYGDYTLVLTSNMVDARLGRNAGTWAGDAWAPTYPQVVKRIAMSKDITRFYKDINKMPEAMRNRVSLQLNSFLEDRPADSFAYWYLFEKGVAPEMAVIPPVFPDDIVKMVSEATDGAFNMWQKSDEQKARCVDAYIAYKYDGDRAAYEADLQNRKERLQRALNTTKSQLVAKKAAGDLAALEEFGFDYDAVSTFLREVETDNSRRGQSDVQGTIRLAEDYIKDNNLEEDYQSWRDSLEGRYGVKEYIFDGYTDSGNQRWLPHTTANASKWMKKQGREGATGTFPSFGLFVATVIPRMTTLNTIRKRKGHLGRPEQAYEAFKEKWGNVYFELGQKLQPDAERFEDYGWWRLIEAVSTNNPKEHIKKQYGIELSAEDLQKLNDMLDAIKTNYPARYFETKFERPVELSEFIAAVVPNDIPADVEASLQDAYLNIYKYDKGVEGSRQEAVLEATDSPSVRFSMRDESFNIAISYIKNIAREYNIKQPIFIAQSADEYVAMMRDAGVKNPESKRKYKGGYLHNADIICINGERFSDTKALFSTLMHERTHAITKGFKDALNAVVNDVSEDVVIYVRDNYLPEKYKKENISAHSTLSEIISNFVGKMPRSLIKGYMEGNILFDDIIKDISVELDGEDTHFISVVTALLPTIKENLEIQKQLYNGRKENAIVIGRGILGEVSGWVSPRRRVLDTRRGNRPLESQSRVLGGDREIEGSAEDRGAEVEHYSLREQVANILDNYDTEGDEYGSMRDVADGVEAIIADAEEDTTALENIVNAYRYAQEEARSWGDRMDAGGDDDFELALRSYAYAGRERYSAREPEHPYGSMRAREEAIAMAERGDYASDIYRKTGWYFDEKHNEWRGNTRLHNDRYMEMRHKEEEAMPFFEDGGDETYIWGDISEEIVENATYKSSEERILAHMKNRHLVARERIRQAAKEDIDNTRRIYNEANLKRNEGLGKRTTKAGKVAYILGDTAPESLSLYDQALVKIALDEVHISWDDIGNKRGLASELGLKKGEKRSYSNITKGATMGLEEFVHGWWQELGGYEKDIDTQDLRNALIEALGEVNRPTQALAALRQKFDTALAERDEVIDRLEFDMEQALLAEDERYNNEVEGFKTSKDKRQRIANYERDVVFFDEAEALGGTLRSVEKKLADVIASSKAKENELKAKHALKRAELRSDAEVARRGLAKYRRSYEEYKELADAINEAKTQIRDVVNNTEVLQFRRREINRLINTLDNARSINDLEYISRRLESLLLDISIRQNRENLNRLLNLRLPNGQYVEAWVNNQIASGAITTAEGKRILTDMWRGTNNKGIRVARYVDGETSAILNYLRNELITPNSRRFYVEEKDAEGNVILDENGKPKKTLTADKELELVVNREIKKAQERIDDITAYFEGNKNKEEVVEKSVPRDIEREALSRYITYLRIVDAKQDIEEAHNALAESDFMLADDGSTEEQKKEARAIRMAAFEQLNVAKNAYNEQLGIFNNDLSELLANGRDAYKAFRDAQEEHRKEIINEALNAIGGRSYLKHPAPTAMQNIRAGAIAGGINNAYYSFQMVLKEIDRYAPNGEGNFYKRYMYGAQSAQDNFIAMQNTHFVQIADKVNELWKEEFKNSNPYVAFKALSDAMSTYRVGTVVYKPFIDKDGEAHGREEWSLVVPNAMYLLAMWQQPRYAMAMAKHGITEEYMLELKDAISSIDYRLIKFMDWVRDELLPNTRLEYNDVYREIFGIDMDMEANYFPAKVIGFHKEEKVEQHEPEVKSSEATGIIARTSRGLMPDPSINYFSILAEHLQKMDQWASFQKLNNDINTLTSNNEFKGRMATLMPGYNDAVNGHGGLVWLWKRTSAIMLNQYKPQENGIDAVFKILQRGWAASNIAWRFMTALKQFASMPVFAVYSLDPECAKLFMQELGFVTSMIVRGRGRELFQSMADEYPTFRKRWTERNAGMEWLTRNISPSRNMVDLRKANKYNLVATAEALDKAFNKLAIEWGMAPNALVDALSVIVGLRTVQAFEEYRISKDKGRLTDEDIELAKVKAAIAINETQQSAEGAYLSVIQMQRSAISVPFVTYLNNTFANHRKRLAGAIELYRQYFDKDWLKEMENRYGDKLPDVRRQAQMKALADIGQGLISDFNFQLLTAAGVIIPMMLNGDDEEEAWYEVGLDAFVAFLSNVAMGGFVGGNIATGLLSGYTPTLMPSVEEFDRDIKKLQSNWKDKRYGEFAYLGLNIAAKNGVGVDLDTFLNMLEGIKAIFDGEGMLGVMKLLNTPQSQIDLIAGAKREGETVMEYVTRRMRLEAIFATSYDDAFNEDGKLINRPFGVSTYMLRQLHNDYETAYRRQVVIREEGRRGWNDMLKIDEEYKDVVKAIGWTAEKKPNNKAFESGEYEAPVEGMTRKQYDKAAKLEEKIASRARKIESFVGTDEKYYSLVKEMTEYKKQLIDNYNELE